MAGGKANSTASKDANSMSSERAVGGGRLVIFILAGQSYAFPIDNVQEIQQIVEPTPLPNAGRALLGVVDLRGSVIPAIDLRTLLGLEQQTYDLQTPMIIAVTGKSLVAVVVDEVDDVVAVPKDCLQPPSDMYEHADRLLGVCRIEGRLIFVLDIDALVPESQVRAVEQLVN